MLELKDFAGYFHRPIAVNVKKMNIYPTVMKKVCRRDGLLIWRNRILISNSVEERASLKIDVAKLEERTCQTF